MIQSLTRDSSEMVLPIAQLHVAYKVNWPVRHTGHDTRAVTHETRETTGTTGAHRGAVVTTPEGGGTDKDTKTTTWRSRRALQNNERRAWRRDARIQSTQAYTSYPLHIGTLQTGVKSSVVTRLERISISRLPDPLL